MEREALALRPIAASQRSHLLANVRKRMHRHSSKKMTDYTKLTDEQLSERVAEIEGWVHDMLWTDADGHPRLPTFATDDGEAMRLLVRWCDTDVVRRSMSFSRHYADEGVRNVTRLFLRKEIPKSLFLAAEATGIHPTFARAACEAFCQICDAMESQ